MSGATTDMDSVMLGEDPVSAVGALTDLLTEEATRFRSLGHLSDKAMNALEALQLTALSAPETGHTHSIATQCEVVAKLTAIDSALGAVTALRLATPPIAVAFGDDAWNAVVASPIPHLSVAFSTVGPAARAVPVVGGWRVSGRWVCPGHRRAGWILVPARIDAGATLMLLVAREQFAIQPRKRAARGFPGLGTRSISLSEKVVPAHRGMPLSALLEGEHAEPGSLAAGPCYGQPIVPRLCALTAAVAVGVARSLLDYVLTASGERAVPRPEFLAANATHVLYAKTHLRELTEAVDRHIDTGEPWSELERAWCRAHASGAARQSWQMADRIRCDYEPAPGQPEVIEQRCADLDALFAHEFLGLDGTRALGEVLSGRPVTDPIL
ncbi:hypothetical protein [Nocardia sp. NPDC057227]|uniref:hypothetical protein n=1 Tax=Nocardia sp. NPDC057227 TaxID=3346056 RepID=UPI00363F42F5